MLLRKTAIIIALFSYTQCMYTMQQEQQKEKSIEQLQVKPAATGSLLTLHQNHRIESSNSQKPKTHTRKVSSTNILIQQRLGKRDAANLPETDGLHLQRKKKLSLQTIPATIGEFKSHITILEESLKLLDTDPKMFGEILFHALHNNKLHTVHFLLSNQLVSVDTEDNTGKTLLYYAIHYACFNLAKELITTHHADLNHRDKAGKSILDFINELMNDLRSKKLPFFQKNITELSHIATLINNYKNAPKSNNPSISSTKIRTSYTKENLAATIKALQKSSEQLARIYLNSTLELLEAAHTGNIPLLTTILTYDINVNILDSNHRSALHIAALGNNIDGVRLLLKDKDIDINAVDREGRNILHYAVSKNNIEMVRLLLKNKNINVNAIDKQGKTPLLLALSWKWNNILESQKRDDIVDALLTLGQANTEASDHNSFKPLHHAIIQENLRTFLSLIGHNANINSLGFEGETPLDLTNQLLSLHKEQLEKHPALKQIKQVLDIYRAHTAEELQAQQRPSQTISSNARTSECKETSTQQKNTIPVYTATQLFSLPASTEPTLPQTTLPLESKEAKPLHFVKISAHHS